ncbi:MAG: hypothetical protein ABS43_15635 [Bordetella sp. SCN 67-23]|nr:hypothetical protein [Burkholderiales bacterium]ODS72846.1 MAG: hypothetical protein ABS43_15635 [Bordetella sp. SCN 67-23]ODU67343.1 MAG: hypothetical protein ABT00_20805 [Bordetella sp. SCN 68-11]OJW93595.1 MAG: hypothetical protein BGO71_16795 [Burkholderiales bacterium 67-32]
MRNVRHPPPVPSPSRETGSAGCRAAVRSWHDPLALQHGLALFAVIQGRDARAPQSRPQRADVD